MFAVWDVMNVMWDGVVQAFKQPDEMSIFFPQKCNYTFLIKLVHSDIFLKAMFNEPNDAWHNCTHLHLAGKVTSHQSRYYDCIETDITTQ